MVTQYSSLIISIQKFLPVRYPNSTTTGTLKFLENRMERKFDYCCGPFGCPLKMKREGDKTAGFSDFIFGNPVWIIRR